MVTDAFKSKPASLVHRCELCLVQYSAHHSNGKQGQPRSGGTSSNAPELHTLKYAIKYPASGFPYIAGNTTWLVPSAFALMPLLQCYCSIYVCDILI